MVLSLYTITFISFSAPLSALVASSDITTDTSMVAFDQYIELFSRSYENDEYQMRKSLYEARVAWIHEHNSNPSKIWTAGLNHLTDRTEEELARIRGWTHTVSSGKRASLLSISEDEEADAGSVLKEVDWANLTSQKVAKDQGECGSCWAVATASMLEARYEIHMKEHRTMSAQELVNCVPNPRECGGQGGCQGATVELALEYVLKHGLATFMQVPYTARDGMCRHHDSLLQRSSGAGDDNHEDGASLGMVSWSTLPMNKAEPLMRAMADGPVAVSVGANNWMFYQNGVFDGCDNDAIINHAVLLVGYGHDTSSGANYWKIQNSWGAHFGENGYMRLHRHDSIAEDNAHCGIDNKPGDGIECKPYPETVPVCGQCGILYDSAAPIFSISGKTAKQVSLLRSLRGKTSKAL